MTGSLGNSKAWMRCVEWDETTTTAAAAWPLAAGAQRVIADKKLPIVGWFVTGSPTSYRHSLSAFRDGLAAAS
jgi:hypothetical protein